MQVDAISDESKVASDVVGTSETSDRTTGETELPRLAIFHHEDSDSILQVYIEAREWCRILWVVGWSAEVPSMRALKRFGEVADVSGMTQDEAVAHIVTFHPDGVAIYSDPPLRLAAAVADELGLPFHSRYTAELLSDKYAQRTALQEAGLPVPAFAPVRAGNFETRVPLPAVLKPRAGAGSRDTFKIENQAQLATAMAMCNPDEEFILEEWLPDRSTGMANASDVVSIESIVRDGVIEHMAVTGRFPFAPPFRETGSFMPSDLSPTEKDAVRALAAAAAQALQIRHAILHTEIKMTPDGPRVIEVNGRLGGGIAELLERVGRPSLRSWVVRLALGQDIGPVIPVGDSPVAFFRWIAAPTYATSLDTVDGLKELGDLPGVDDVRLNRRPGDPLDPREGGAGGHVVRVTGVVPSHAELFHLVHEQVDSTLQMTWVSGPVGDGE